MPMAGTNSPLDGMARRSISLLEAACVSCESAAVPNNMAPVAAPEDCFRK
jgi:hypothetical protein